MVTPKYSIQEFEEFKKKPIHLVQQLTEQKNKTNLKQEKLNQSKNELTKSIDSIRKSTLFNSDTIQESTKSKILELEGNVIQINNLNAESKQLDESDQFESLGIEMEKTQVEIGIEVRNLEKAGRLIWEAMKNNPTQTISAALTGLALPIAVLTSPVSMPVVLGTTAVTSLVAGKQLFNIIKEQAAQTGAIDPLRAIDKALQQIGKLEKKNDEVIQKIEEKSKAIDLSVGQLSATMNAIEEKLNDVKGETKDILTGMLEALRNAQKANMQQRSHLRTALMSANDVSFNLKNQSARLDALKDKEYDVSTPEKAEKVIEDILNEVARIKQSSDQSQKSLGIVIESLLNSISANRQIDEFGKNFQTLITKLAVVEVDLSNALQEVFLMQQQIHILEKEKKGLSDAVSEEKKISEQRKNQLNIASEQLKEAEKKVADLVDPFGVSTTGGNLMGMGTGALAGGLLIGGALGPIVGTILGGTFLSKYLISGLHDARMIIHAGANIGNEITMEKWGQALAKTKVNPKGKFEMKATYDIDSKGSYLGAKGRGEVQNLLSYYANILLGQEIPKYHSTRSGTCVIKISNLPAFKIEFDKGAGASKFYETLNAGYGIGYFTGASKEVTERDKAKKNYEEYGAVSIPNQQDLVSALDEALDKELIPPQMVLEFLDGLNEVYVEDTYEVVCLIRKNSKITANLKKKCADKLEKLA